MGFTVVEKIAAARRVDPGAAACRAGEVVHLVPDHVMSHDNSWAILAKFRALGGRRVAAPRMPVIVLDHDIQNRAPAHLARYAEIESFAVEQGIDFHPPGTGIGHQIVVERLYARPGGLVVASDSHANLYGAIGAVGTPITRSDAAAAWATGTFWWRVPPTVQVRFEGRLGAGACGKDIALVLCAAFPETVLGSAVEFSGPGVATLSMDDRMAIANMTTEWGAVTGCFPADATTSAWIEDRRRILGAVPPPHRSVDPDPDAAYAARIVLDLATVTAHVTGPDTVSVAAPLAEIEARGVRIDKAYLLSCANGRLSDFESAARVVAGRTVAPGVEFYIGAASREVQQAAERSGAWDTLLGAGARPLPPGCGPCIGLGAGLLRDGETGISATNRNFKGRMGSTAASCWLAGPEIVAASAIAGRIRGPGAAASIRPAMRLEIPDPPPAPPAPPLEPDFPGRIEGRLVVLAADAIDTDAIFPSAHLYDGTRDDAALAAVAFRNLDPTLAERLRPGDLIVTGERFGVGSSREQAVSALIAAGVRGVVAASFSDTYLRNAWNLGLLTVEAPDALRSLGARATVPGGALVLDFEACRGAWADRSFAIRPPPLVAQRLWLDGGLEARVRRVLQRRVEEER